jgi:hypothetical protein
MSGSAFTSASNGFGRERGPLSTPTGAGRPRPARVRALPALVVAIALLVGGAGAQAQFFSPGPLARPHASLEGLDNCAKCHAQQKSLSPERCLACHVELEPEIAKHAGLHGRMTAETRDQCQRCHPDHRGRDFQIVDWQGARQKFQHARTGYPLEGKHAQLGCDACHASAKVTAPEIARLLHAEPGRTTYLGLSARCDSCHFDEHRGQLDSRCQACHGQVTWRPAPAFNHQDTKFALRGKHRSVACAKCHPSVTDDEPPPRAAPAPRAPSYLQMKPVDHTTCASCHDDPHDGNLGPQCASCHTETGWKIVSPAGGIDRAFHKRTAFPLAGAHASVPCRGCHGPFPGSPARYHGLTFARCADCHSDAHVGQLAVAGQKGAPDCAACHDVNAFAPARFELEQHARTRFPLDGAHAATACRACHPLDPRLESLVPAPVRGKLRQERRPLLISTATLRPKRSPEQCSTCHQDPHQGQFAAQIRENDCRGCHVAASFKTLKFDHGADSRFPLTGAHRQVACAGCHPTELIRPKAPPAVRYAPLPLTCGGCHADQHQGQFTWEVPRRGSARPAADAATLTAATATGTTTAPAPASASGRPLAAESAGGGVRPGPNPAVVRRGAPHDCAFCHQTTTFAQSLFSHEDPRFTTFALKGKHARLACGACHRSVEVAPGVATVRYRPVPRSCAECHVDFHKGAFQGFEP